MRDLEVRRLRIAPPDRAHGEPRAVQYAGDAIAERRHALRVEVLAKDVSYKRGHGRRCLTFCHRLVNERTRFRNSHPRDFMQLNEGIPQG